MGEGTRALFLMAWQHRRIYMPGTSPRKSSSAAPTQIRPEHVRCQAQNTFYSRTRMGRPVSRRF
jgi:hypothetical protein